MSNLTRQLMNYNEGRVGTTIHVDLAWCIATILVTLLASWYVNFSIAVTLNPILIELLAGVIQAIVYLQVITLVVLASSYMSERISKYRGLLLNILPLAIYVVVSVYMEPKPVDIVFSYGAYITLVGITFYKLKALIHFLYATVFVPATVSKRIYRSNR